MRKDYQFVGGPYNGNYFTVADESQEHSITSHTGGYAIQHVYVLDPDTGTYIYECRLPLVAG